jgi:hypothetical protein
MTGLRDMEKTPFRFRRSINAGVRLAYDMNDDTRFDRT